MSELPPCDSKNSRYCHSNRRGVSCEQYFEDLSKFCLAFSDGGNKVLFQSAAAAVNLVLLILIFQGGEGARTRENGQRRSVSTSVTLKARKTLLPSIAPFFFRIRSTRGDNGSSAQILDCIHRIVKTVQQQQASWN